MHYFKFYRTLVRSLPTLIRKKLIGWGVSPPPSPLLENKAMRRDLKTRPRVNCAGVCCPHGKTV